MLSVAKHLASAFQGRFFALLRMTTLGGCDYSDRHFTVKWRGSTNPSSHVSTRSNDFDMHLIPQA